jgi:hypothetical protein
MKKLFARVLVSVIAAVSKKAYRRGLRPKRGSLLYSPSLDAMYALKGFLKGKKRK